MLICELLFLYSLIALVVLKFNKPYLSVLQVKILGWIIAGVMVGALIFEMLTIILFLEKKPKDKKSDKKEKDKKEKEKKEKEIEKEKKEKES